MKSEGGIIIQISNGHKKYRVVTFRLPINLAENAENIDRFSDSRSKKVLGKQSPKPLYDQYFQRYRRLEIEKSAIFVYF